MAKLIDQLKKHSFQLPDDAPLQTTAPIESRVVVKVPTETAVKATTEAVVKTIDPSTIVFDSREYFNSLLQPKTSSFTTKQVYIREEYAAVLNKLSAMSGVSMKIILDNILEPMLSKGGEYSISEHIVTMMKNDIKNQF